MSSNFNQSEILQQELDASPGSFIGGVRFDLRWNSEKFTQLCTLMHSAAKLNCGRSELPRDLSQLFWYCGTFLPLWLEQRDFRVGQPFVDYDKACSLLKRLGGEWFGDDSLLTDEDFAARLKAVAKA